MNCMLFAFFKRRMCGNGISMETLKNIFNQKKIQISLRCIAERKTSRNMDLHSFQEDSDVDSAAINREIQTVAENRDFFDSLFTKHPLSAVRDINDFYYFLLAKKISSMQGPVYPFSSQYSQLLKGIADKASDIYKQGKRDAINYLNDHTDEIFQDSQSDCDLRNAALDSIIELQGAIHKEVFKYLCQKRPSMIIERFDDLERVFDKAENSDLFTTLFPSGHYFPGDNQSGQKLIDSLWLQSVLDIWKKEYSKNTGRRWLIENYISELSQDAESLCDELSEWNVYEAETAVKSLCSFLKEIKSHKSDDLSEDITAVEKLEIKIRDDKVTFVQHLFDNLGAKKWRNTTDSKSKLLMLTHYHVDPGKYKSHLSKKKEMSKGENRTDVPDDKFFSPDYRRELSRLEAYQVAYFMAILRDQSAFDEYSRLVEHRIRYISGKIPKHEDGLTEDTEMMLAMLHLEYQKLNNTSQEQIIFCYSLSVFICSLIEKLLRMFYCCMTKVSDFENLTLGKLLNVQKTKLVSAFGSDHIRALAYFLTSTPGIKLGRNYRNSLDHWSLCMSPGDMTPIFASSLLWLFTDILNSVSLYFDSQH